MKSENVTAESEISALLEEKLFLFKQYLSFTQRMKEALNNKNQNNLGSLIVKRQDCIKKIESVMKNGVQTGLNLRKRISGKLKKGTDNYLHAIKSIVQTLEPLDREVMVLAKQEGENIRTELLRRRNVRQVTRGYTQRIRHPARFLDTRR
ncbi:MAG: hypothetical protein KKH68_04310 [Proteobacteria bacterium]|nr:hypothetical protein [Pseudomonadota bacterium]